MLFFMIIGKELLYICRERNGALEPVYIHGNQYQQYNPYSNTIKDDIRKILEAVADQHNLDAADGIDISLVENADRVRNENIKKALSGNLKRTIPLNDVLLRLVNSLRGKKELHIDDFGINYDGDSYILRNGQLQRSAYSLLAYTVKPEEFRAHI